MELQNETGSVACPDLGLIVSGNEVLCAAILLLISSLSLHLSTLYCGMQGNLGAGLQVKCNKFPDNKLRCLHESLDRALSAVGSRCALDAQISFPAIVFVFSALFLSVERLISGTVC